MLFITHQKTNHLIIFMLLFIYALCLFTFMDPCLIDLRGITLSLAGLIRLIRMAFIIMVCTLGGALRILICRSRSLLGFDVRLLICLVIRYLRKNLLTLRISIRFCHRHKLNLISNGAHKLD